MIRRFYNYILDENEKIRNRMFTLTSVIILTCFVLAIILSLILRRYEYVLGEIVTVLILSGIIYTGNKAGKLPLASAITCLIVVTVVMPFAYYVSGGATGGIITVYVLVTLYVCLSLEGWIRPVVVAAELICGGVCFYMEYTHPQWFPEQDTIIRFIAMYLVTMLVSTFIVFLVNFQIAMLKKENERSREQRDEIERLNAAQNRFFSSMSHEIRTPINTIIGLNEMILRENASDEINENAASIQAASNLLLHIINDILDMSKFESGQMQLTQSAYHTGDMLSEIVGMLWLRAKEKNLEFHVNVAPDLPEMLIGDEVRIKQILINVLNNAIKYTSEGSVSLSIQCEKKSNGNADVIYSVADTGMGIKKESIPYLFTAFKRVDEDKNKYIEGTGLGLSIVKQFVDLMGGKISVNSVYTKGSTFNIVIPQQIASDSNIGELDMERRHSLNRHENYHQSFEAPEAKVLVVDDTAANLLVVGKLLRDTKVQITTASSGEDALKETLKEEFHVIFMDHMMPGMDGIECSHAIREQAGGRCKDARIIALTANAGGESAALYEKEGFDGYLTKPITGEALENELRHQLPRELVVMTGSDEEFLEESLSWSSEHTKKAIVTVTTESVADIPKDICERYGIAVLPHMVKTDGGLFRDGLEIDQSGLLLYMENSDAKVETVAPEVEEHEVFFAEQLGHANNVIHLAISSGVAHSGCPAAMKAALAFDNVYIVDSGHLSSGQGLMTILAADMAESGRSVEEILATMEELKDKVHTSFIVDNLDYLARAGQLNSRIAGATKSLMMHPVLTLRKGKMGIGKVFFGNRMSAWEHYIDSILKNADKIDRSILFVTYAGIPQSELEWIRKEITKRADFTKIYFQKASPAVAANCGPGSFGLLYVEK